MKKVILFIIMLAFVLNMTACLDGGDTEEKMRNDQERITSQANSKIGMPAIRNFQEKQLVKMLYELRDQSNLQTYTYMFAENTGRLVYIGRSIGYGIPYAAQFSNPQKVDSYNHGIVLPQSEPNGLYLPTDAEGTWIMLIDESTGTAKPTYIEPRIVVSQFKLNI